MRRPLTPSSRSSSPAIPPPLPLNNAKGSRTLDDDADSLSTQGKKKRLAPAQTTLNNPRTRLSTPSAVASASSSSHRSRSRTRPHLPSTSNMPQSTMLAPRVSRSISAASSLLSNASSACPEPRGATFSRSSSVGPSVTSDVEVIGHVLPVSADARDVLEDWKANNATRNLAFSDGGDLPEDHNYLTPFACDPIPSPPSLSPRSRRSVPLERSKSSPISRDLTATFEAALSSDPASSESIAYSASPPRRPQRSTTDPLLTHSRRSSRSNSGKGLDSHSITPERPPLHTYTSFETAFDLRPPPSPPPPGCEGGEGVSPGTSTGTRKSWWGRR